MPTNRITYHWNGNLVLEGTCSAVMALQIAEGVCNEFAGDTAREARHELWQRNLLSSINHRGELPATEFIWRDETGEAAVSINAS